MSLAFQTGSDCIHPQGYNMNHSMNEILSLQKLVSKFVISDTALKLGSTHSQKIQYQTIWRDKK